MKRTHMENKPDATDGRVIYYRLRANNVVVFFVNVSLEIITMVESQRAYGAGKVHGAGSSGAAGVEVHAVDVLLQTVGVQVHVVAQRTTDVGVGVEFPSFRRRADAGRRAGGRVYVTFGYVVGQFVLGEERLATYLAYRLRSERHFRVAGAEAGGDRASRKRVRGRRENEKTRKRWSRRAKKRMDQTTTSTGGPRKTGGRERTRRRIGETGIPIVSL